MAELVLTKIDRASMANSLEVRVPFLSKRVFEQIHASALDAYVQNGSSKFPIYAYLCQSVNKAHLDRPKQGFVGPDSYYMNKQFYLEALKDSFLVKDGIIRQAFLDQELKLQYNWRLWKLVVLEKWYAHWRQFINN
jgi:asparagine synthase (glutamine-hydrolysing)